LVGAPESGRPSGSTDGLRHHGRAACLGAVP